MRKAPELRRLSAELPGYENHCAGGSSFVVPQVPGDPRIGYSHVYGAPGVSAVAIVERA